MAVQTGPLRSDWAANRASSKGRCAPVKQIKASLDRVKTKWMCRTKWVRHRTSDDEPEAENGRTCRQSERMVFKQFKCKFWSNKRIVKAIHGPSACSNRPTKEEKSILLKKHSKAEDKSTNENDWADEQRLMEGRTKHVRRPKVRRTSVLSLVRNSKAEASGNIESKNVRRKMKSPKLCNESGENWNRQAGSVERRREISKAEEEADGEEVNWRANEKLNRIVRFEAKKDEEDEENAEDAKTELNLKANEMWKALWKPKTSKWLEREGKREREREDGELGHRQTHTLEK